MEHQNLNTKSRQKTPKFQRAILNRKHIKENSWSHDAYFGEALKTGRFNRSEMVCTKTLYNYIDLGLLDINNFNLPLKLRRNTKPSKARAHKKSFGRSIAERHSNIETREDFGHWKINTVNGKKTADNCVLMTHVERKTRHAIIRKIESKSADSIMKEFNHIREYFGDIFGAVFKTITGDNGSEFADLSTLENLIYGTRVYFHIRIHPLRKVLMSDITRGLL